MVERDAIHAGTARPPARMQGHAALGAVVARLLAACLALIALTSLAAAACLPIAEEGRALFHKASRVQALAAAAPGTVALSYLGHSSFLLETPEGASVVTDYNGFIRPPFVPDIVTMNNAHPMHFTEAPHPEIKHVLRGWDDGERLARHHLRYKDLVVRNVPTNVRDVGGTRFNGNSIFVFEAETLCIAHLGHLQHSLTNIHLGELGQIDVLLAPVDGAYTMDQFDMVEAIRAIAAPLVIPMHFFTEHNLKRFLDRMSATHAIRIGETPNATLSRAGLSRGKPEVLVLPGH